MSRCDGESCGHPCVKCDGGYGRHNVPDCDGNFACACGPRPGVPSAAAPPSLLKPQTITDKDEINASITFKIEPREPGDSAHVIGRTSIGSGKDRVPLFLIQVGGHVYVVNDPLDPKALLNASEVYLTVKPRDTRDPKCVERWPECSDGAHDPKCRRFPKSCSCGTKVHGRLD